MGAGTCCAILTASPYCPERTASHVHYHAFAARGYVSWDLEMLRFSLEAYNWARLQRVVAAQAMKNTHPPLPPF